MRYIKFVFAIICLLLASVVSWSQSGNIRGFVYDKDDGEPMIFTNVYLLGTTIGGATDINGYFNISKIKEGSYTLVVSFIGYDTLKVPVNIKPNEIITKKLYLVKSSIQLEELVVSAEKQEMRTETHTSIVKISPKQMERLPTVGSEPDIAQYLQIVPGVVFTGDQGGQLYIRGGTPIQNKVLLDGMTVFNPFHSIGLFSVFDSDIIKNTDVYTGGFGAEYGGAISSVMDITTRDGNKKQLSGKFSASTFGSKILLEGPFSKPEEGSHSSTSFIFSGKTSYLEQSSKIFYNYIDKVNGLPFNYTDLYGKISVNADNGSKVNFFGFKFNDHVNYPNVFDMKWNETGLGSNVVLVPSGSNVLVKANMSWSKYSIDFNEFIKQLTSNSDQYQTQINNSEISNFNFGLDFTYFLGNNQLDYGLATSGCTTQYVFENSIGRRIGVNEPKSTTELSGYLKFKYTYGKLIFEPSFRLEYYASLSEISPEPRLGIKYLVNDKFRIKFGGGLYSQSVISTVSDRDVVNLFSGYISEVDNLQAKFNGVSVNSNLQKSVHSILGFEYDINNNLNLNVEAYYKYDPQLINLNKNKIYDDTYANISVDDYYKKDFIIEQGHAYGLDFLLKYDYKRVYLWFVYSLGYLKHYDGVYTYNPLYDRRHNINLVGSYVFGRDLNWELNARWNLGSGFPFLQTQGYYELIPFYNGINTQYQSSSGDLGVLYSDIQHQGRLPYYHRLDMTIKRDFFITTTSTFEVVVSVTNVYDRSNIFYYDRIKNQRVNQLPILPSIGLSLTF
ncbi:MAG: TonB-dependent receptor [Bacteroidia bacterium]|nr:TonB-dependent receptor [Bacteroidia bacterium]